MNVKMDTSILEGIVADISKIPDMTDKETKQAMAKVGNIIKKNVQSVLPKSSAEHRHVREDIKVTAKVSDGIGRVIVGGGRDTAYKWHMLDDGTRNADGTVKTEPLHFTVKALEKSQKDIDALVDEICRKVADGDTT